MSRACGKTKSHTKQRQDQKAKIKQTSKMKFGASISKAFLLTQVAMTCLSRTECQLLRASVARRSVRGRARNLAAFDQEANDEVVTPNVATKENDLLNEPDDCKWAS